MAVDSNHRCFFGRMPPFWWILWLFPWGLSLILSVWSPFPFSTLGRLGDARCAGDLPASTRQIPNNVWSNRQLHSKGALIIPYSPYHGTSGFPAYGTRGNSGLGLADLPSTDTFHNAQLVRMIHMIDAGNFHVLFLQTSSWSRCYYLDNIGLGLLLLN